MPHQPHSEPYHVGDNVPKEGQYVCVPCGFKKKLKPGDVFGECLSCFKDEGWHQSWDEQDTEDELADQVPEMEEEELHRHDEEGAEVAEGQELWEEVRKPEDLDKEPQIADKDETGP